MATGDEDRRGDAGLDDRGYLPGIPSPVRNLIGRADDLVMQELTLDELGRFANAEQSIERLSKAKEELVLKVLARHKTDWRLRLTPFHKICFDKCDGAEGPFPDSDGL